MAFKLNASGICIESSAFKYAYEHFGIDYSDIHITDTYLTKLNNRIHAAKIFTGTETN